MKSLSLLLAIVLAGGCARAPAPVAPALSPTAAAPASPVVPAPVPAAVPASAVAVLVHKSPTCSCCSAWVEHLRQAGFVVRVEDSENLDPVKARLGVPAEKASCHTAEAGGYVIEGHVPAEDIRRLLAEKPDARGLVLPGMPIGSPGMGEPGSGPAYTVELLARDGSSQPYARHGR